KELIRGLDHALLPPLFETVRQEEQVGLQRSHGFRVRVRRKVDMAYVDARPGFESQVIRAKCRRNAGVVLDVIPFDTGAQYSLEPLKRVQPLVDIEWRLIG